MYLLVAEYNELNREIMYELLNINGISCDFAANDKECIELFKNSGDKYDAVLMDLQMPILNGIEAAKRLRALNFPHAKTVPIIAMTANALSSDIQSCMSAGMNKHLSNPIDIEKLLKALAKTTN